MMFDNYRVPYETLLNKTADVLPDGTYTTPYKDPNKRLGKSSFLPALYILGVFSGDFLM